MYQQYLKKKKKRFWRHHSPFSLAPTHITYRGHFEQIGWYSIRRSNKTHLLKSSFLATFHKSTLANAKLTNLLSIPNLTKGSSCSDQAHEATHPYQEGLLYNNDNLKRVFQRFGQFPETLFRLERGQPGLQSL